MATETFNFATLFNLSTALNSGRRLSPGGFPVTDGDTDDDFDLGDTLTFGGFSGPYLGTMDFGGDTYPVMRTDTEVVILGLNALPASLPSLFSWTLNETGQPACFAQGTRIATPSGACAVEDLAPGDALLRADGGITRALWIGVQTISRPFGAGTGRALVRVQRGALGRGLPTRDLTLTADHALLLEGLLVDAGALVNGSTIAHVPLEELGLSYRVYHIETETHDVILAEGAPAETFVDYVSRSSFDNYDSYLALFGDDLRVQEAEYPRVHAPRQLPDALRSRLCAREPA